MKRIKHFIAHLFGHNTGEVVSWWDIDALFVGFECDECHEVSGATMVGVYHYPDGKPEFRWKFKAERMPFGVKREQLS